MNRRARTEPLGIVVIKHGRRRESHRGIQEGMAKEVEGKPVRVGTHREREYFKKWRVFRECQMLSGAQVRQGVRESLQIWQ